MKSFYNSGKIYLARMILLKTIMIKLMQMTNKVQTQVTGVQVLYDKQVAVSGVQTYSLFATTSQLLPVEGSEMAPQSKFD